MSPSMLELDARGLASLREAYAAAVEKQAAEFTWRGHRLVTAFARYVIQYAEKELAPVPEFLRRRDAGSEP